MKSVFCDTSGLYAVIEPADAHHSAATATWRALLDDGRPLVTISYVLVETLAVVRRRSGIAKVRAFAQAVSGLIETHFVDQALHETALSEVLLQNRRSLSIVDCASFAFMQRHGLGTFFGFDRHFLERGYTQFFPKAAR